MRSRCYCNVLTERRNLLMNNKHAMKCRWVNSETSLRKFWDNFNSETYVPNRRENCGRCALVLWVGWMKRRRRRRRFFVVVVGGRFRSGNAFRDNKLPFRSGTDGDRFVQLSRQKKTFLGKEFLSWSLARSLKSRNAVPETTTNRTTRELTGRRRYVFQKLKPTTKSKKTTTSSIQQ